MNYRCYLFFLFYFVSSCCFAQNIDIDILRSINKHETGFQNDFFKAETQSVTVFNIGAPAAMFTVGLIKHDKQLQKNAAYTVGAFLVSTIATQGLKHIIKRERPFNEYTDIVKRDEGGGYSFPSGHTSAAFCTATSLSIYFPKWYVIVPAYVWAGSVGYARMYQGVHYPSDVLTGAIIGAGSAWLSYQLQRKLEGKRNKKGNVKLPFE
ncbi:MAG: phosphatase PAP2 family protein [Sphingobacteriales bacterium]|nr:phosphatase PAP2 family protein [Sphingobacteriales bacterium]